MLIIFPWKVKKLTNVWKFRKKVYLYQKKIFYKIWEKELFLLKYAIFEHCKNLKKKQLMKL